MTACEVINAPLQGKRKPRFSLSEEQKAANGLFATLSIQVLIARMNPKY